MIGQYYKNLLKEKMKKLISILFVLTVLLTACTPSPEEIAKQTADAATSTAMAWTQTPAPSPMPTEVSFTAQLSVSADVPPAWAGKLHVTVDDGVFKYSSGAQAMAGSSIYVTETELANQSGALIIIVDQVEVELGGTSYQEGDRLTVSSTGQFVVAE
jgi:hypothetical protein